MNNYLILYCNEYYNFAKPRTFSYSESIKYKLILYSFVKTNAIICLEFQAYLRFKIITQPDKIIVFNVVYEQISKIITLAF